MIKRYFHLFFLLTLTFVIFNSIEAKVISVGIAIFIVGMFFLEDGFKLFSGSVLENILKNSTNNTPKAIGVGFLSTSIMQSSSLVSIIIISFLSAELITLSGAIGVIFGSNIGTTTTAWIVSTFGVKIKISTYAMPMIIFGAIFRFSDNKNYQALGYILLGLGFVFLGIGYMKEGFESLKSSINLAELAIEGYLGVLVYVLIGALATIILQSSSAAMALIITALATEQIIFINSLELAIGANIGTTVTAIIGSLASNHNGKRLAVAHFIFNLITALIAIVFLYQLADLTTYLGGKIGIADNYAMQLALFHTIFNLIGVIVLAPFIPQLVRYLKTLFIQEKQQKLKAKYLDDTVLEVQSAATKSIKKEIEHLYDITIEEISHSIYLHKHKLNNLHDLKDMIQNTNLKLHSDIDKIYTSKIKSLYGEIIEFATKSQTNMDDESKDRIYELKIASRSIVEALKLMEDIHKNVNLYIKSNNTHIQQEYNHIRINIANIINEIENIRNSEDDIENLTSIELLKDVIKQIDLSKNEIVDELIRNEKINSKMATSLINDTALAYEISKKLINSASILWIVDKELRELGDEI
jgi:phosphate:Na+ symporter